MGKTVHSTAVSVIGDHTDGTVQQLSGVGGDAGAWGRVSACPQAIAVMYKLGGGEDPE
jgi:hypothetical protein